MESDDRVARKVRVDRLRAEGIRVAVFQVVLERVVQLNQSCFKFFAELPHYLSVFFKVFKHPAPPFGPVV